MASAVRAEGNVSHREQQVRMRVGVALFGVTLLAGLLLVRAEVPIAYRLLLIIPFWFATGAFFSSVSGVCGFVARKCQRHTCDGVVRIADKNEVLRLKAAARRTTIQSLIATALATAPFLLVQ